MSNPVEAENLRVHWQGSDCLGAPRLDLPGVELVLPGMEIQIIVKNYGNIPLELFETWNKTLRPPIPPQMKNAPYA